MTDYKTQDLPSGASTTLAATDIVMLTRDPGGSPADYYITGANLKSQIFTQDVDGNDYTLHGFEGEINTQTGTTYGTLAGDNGKIITLNNASAITLTVLSTAPAGYNCLLIQAGAGQVTIAAGGTGNIRNRSSHTKIAGQYGMVSVFVVSNAGTAPEVYIAGDTAA